MSDDTKIFMVEPVKIELFDKKTKVSEIIEVSEFTLRNRGKFLKIISAIFLDLNEKNPNLKTMALADVIAAFIDTAEDRLVGIYELVTGKSAEWLIENLTLKNEMALLKAIIEVNDIPFLVSQIRPMIQSVKV